MVIWIEGTSPPFDIECKYSMNFCEMNNFRYKIPLFQVSGILDTGHWTLLLMNKKTTLVRSAVEYLIPNVDFWSDTRAQIWKIFLKGALNVVHRHRLHITRCNKMMWIFFFYSRLKSRSTNNLTCHGIVKRSSFRNVNIYFIIICWSL